MQSFIRRRLGETKPKQYCTFLGSRSLLQHAVDRADALTSPKRRIVVAAEHHEPYLREQMLGRDGGRILFQPKNRGTAPGIFLPLTHVLASDPHAMVTIYPSDHFVHPEDAFTSAVARALSASAELGGRPLVLGVEAADSEGDYGWIHRGTEIARAGGRPVWNVDRFMEKPGRDAMKDIRGAFWNTFVITGSVQLLWDLGWRYVREIMPLFVQLWDSIDTPEEAAVLKQIYKVMPERDFSAHILEQAVRHLVLMNLEGVYWSDWGREERVVETLDRLGIESAFSKERVLEKPNEERTYAVYGSAFDLLPP